MSKMKAVLSSQNKQKNQNNTRDLNPSVPGTAHCVTLTDLKYAVPTCVALFSHSWLLSLNATIFINNITTLLDNSFFHMLYVLFTYLHTYEK